MATYLVRGADWLVTMDDERRVLSDASLFAEDGIIRLVGKSSELPATADEVFDARGYVVLPGMVNCHHHMFQGLTRCAPGAQGMILQEWLLAHYPLWLGFTADAYYASARLVLAELLLSGCTTAFDHHYLYPAARTLDRAIDAARELGIRFVGGRGCQTIGAHNGGITPESLCDTDEEVLEDCERLIRTYHDANPFAMTQVAIAPVQLFRIHRSLAIQLIDLARKHQVRGHVHLCETTGEFGTFLKISGRRPFEYAQDVGWAGSDVWYAHGIHFDDSEIEQIGRLGGGVAHCPSSNMRLGSGVAPIGKLEAAGVAVGLGVDGSASNDCSNMLAEARLAMLLQRVERGASALTGDKTLELATRGGASLLGRSDLGVLAPGKAADFIGFDTRRREFAGALADPVAALVFCLVPNVDLSVIGGKVRVRDGQIVEFDWAQAVALHNQYADDLVRYAEKATGQSFQRQERSSIEVGR